MGNKGSKKLAKIMIRKRKKVNRNDGMFGSKKRRHGHDDGLTTNAPTHVSTELAAGKVPSATTEGSACNTSYSQTIFQNLAKTSQEDQPSTSLSEPVVSYGEDSTHVQDPLVESEAGMGRRSKAAEALRKRRAEMTEEQRQEVSKKMAADYAARIATETPEQKEMRLSKQRKTSRSRYRNMRAAEDAARRKEVFDKLAAEGGLPERREKRARKSVDEVTEKKYPVRYYRRLANEGQLLVPAHSVALDEPGPSYRNDSSDGDQDMEDDDERFGAIIAAELRSIDDPEEKETVIAAIKKVLHESRVRRRQKKQIEIKLQPETQSKPVVSVPRPIDDRTEEEKAVSSIKSEPDEPIDDEITPTDESIPNLDCQPETPIPMPVDDRTEEQIAVDAIKEEPVDPSYLGDSSSTFSHPEPDPLCDPAARQPITDITEADAAVAAIKQEPVETYEITISDVNMGDV
ncbi:uncharacterized protein LOC121735701 isoform X2 [Aricia agestis]|uniref:uncharacterized protein LOC121735701 isoform X2 n=1 Tax=Aricia agestis TaxID=91739 RepID=UPI001C2034F3|nr:uncharacterized protein LOC121735701 isoform X2 [Aricia agestis]